MTALSDQGVVFRDPLCTKVAMWGRGWQSSLSLGGQFLAYQTLQRLFLSLIFSTCHLQSDGCLCGLRGIAPPSTCGVCSPSSGLQLRLWEPSCLPDTMCWWWQLCGISGLVEKRRSFVLSSQMSQELPGEWMRPSADKFNCGGWDGSSQFQGVCFSFLCWLVKVSLISLQWSIGYMVYGIAD